MFHTLQSLSWSTRVSRDACTANGSIALFLISLMNLIVLEPS